MPWMRHLSARHREVMRLVRMAAHHEGFGLGVPVVEVRLFDLMGVRRNHPLDRRDRSAGAGNCHLYPAFDRLSRGIGLEGQLIHVDEMLTKHLEIDPGPVGFGVGLEDPHDLLHSAESIFVRAWSA